MTKDELLLGIAKLMGEFEDTNPDELNHTRCSVILADGNHYWFNGDRMVSCRFDAACEQVLDDRDRCCRIVEQAVPDAATAQGICTKIRSGKDLLGLLEKWQREEPDHEEGRHE